MTFISLIPSLYTNVLQYGATGDGSTDDTAAIAAAIAAVRAAGGGTVFLPPGTYITGNQTLYANVHLRGAGIGATTLKLKSGANTDLLSAQTSSINLSASFGVGTVGSLYNFSIQDITLDGNKAGQSSGPSYVLRFYGYGYIIQNVRIRNGYSGGVLADWNGGSNSPGQDSMEAQWINVKIHDNTGIGLQFGGPHDSQFLNVISYLNHSHAFHFAPNSGVCQITNAHGWGSDTGQSAVTFLVEAQAIFENCQAEGSDTVQVALLANGSVWQGGYVFSGAGVSSAFQIGQAAGNTPYNGEVQQSAGVTTAVGVQHCVISTLVHNCDGTAGAFWFANDGGKNTIRAHVDTTTSGILYSTSPDPSTQLTATINGPTNDGTVPKAGQHRIGINAFSAFLVNNLTNDVLNVNSDSGRIELPSATVFRQYSDAYSTRTVELSNGTVSLYPSSSAAALASSGTITTSGVGIARVNPAAAVTGVILQAGTNAGQIVIVRNESAFSITFAAAATSHVADGTSDIIAANTSRMFEWNSVASRWSRMG